MKNKLRYEFLLLTSLGFIYFEYNKFQSIKLVKISKKICNKSFYRNKYKKECNYYLFKTTDIVFIFYLNYLNKEIKYL